MTRKVQKHFFAQWKAPHLHQIEHHTTLEQANVVAYIAVKLHFIVKTTVVHVYLTTPRLVFSIKSASIWYQYPVITS